MPLRPADRDGGLSGWRRRSARRRRRDAGRKWLCLRGGAGVRHIQHLPGRRGRARVLNGERRAESGARQREKRGCNQQGGGNGHRHGNDFRARARNDPHARVVVDAHRLTAPVGCQRHAVRFGRCAARDRIDRKPRHVLRDPRRIRVGARDLLNRPVQHAPARIENREDTRDGSVTEIEGARREAELRLRTTGQGKQRDGQ